MIRPLFTSWSIGSAKNCIAWRIRGLGMRPTRRTIGIEKAEEATMDPAGASERRMDVMEVLQKLSPEHREVIVMRELEGMGYEEIAAALKIPRGTVESRLHRARQELKAKFQ